ncbi:hypothetical protein ACSXAY_17065 (plasmid) [Clostridium perfringens]
MGVKLEIYFISYEKDCGYHQHIWISSKSDYNINNNGIILNAPNIIDDGHTLVYGEIIKPYELALQDYLLL